MNDPEYDDDEGILPEDELNDGMPEVETAEEYGYVEPPVVPAPADADDQNPGFVEGAHA